MDSDADYLQNAARNTQVLLDGVVITMPEGWGSLAAIRCYLERLALERHRLLHMLEVEHHALVSDGPPREVVRSLQVRAKTLPLDLLPSQVIQMARGQVAAAVLHLELLVAQVLINHGPQARELWWHTAQSLKAPLLTLSALFGAGGSPHAGANVLTLRRWEREQLAAIMKEVDLVARLDDTFALATVLEERVLGWLAGLERTLNLLYVTLLAKEEPFTL